MLSRSLRIMQGLASLLLCVCTLWTGAGLLAAGNVGSLAFPFDGAIRDPSIDDYFVQFLRENPCLINGGSQIFPVETGWLAVGVALAPIKDSNDAGARRLAIQAAEANANKCVAEAINGTKMSVQEAVSKRYIVEGDRATVTERFSLLSKEEIEGTLRRSEQVGTWLTSDGCCQGVMVVVLSPKAGSRAFDAGNSSNESSIDWEKAIEQRPRLQFGGVALRMSSGKARVFAVGLGRLIGDPLKDSINAPLAAEVDARKRVVQYLLGFKTRSTSEIVKEVTLFQSGDDEQMNSLVDSVQKSTEEKAKGAVRMMQRVAQWKSLDGKLLFCAFVLELSDAFKPE